MDYKEILDAIKEIIVPAGKILLAGFRSADTTIAYKSKTDIVTNIDRESERFLVQAISERFPDHTIIAEEGSRRDAGGDYVWYIDPLDATNNYAHGIPFFCISIGVFSRSADSVVAGAVYDPYHDELFTATAGGGAFLNGAPVAVSSIGDIGIALIATGFPYTKKDPEKNNVRQFCAMLPQIQCIRRIGSAALDLCYVACGRMDGFWEPLLKPWDMAAGSLIVHEAGGRVSRFDGSPFLPEVPEIVASNGALHDTIVRIINRMD